MVLIMKIFIIDLVQGVLDLTNQLGCIFLSFFSNQMYKICFRTKNTDMKSAHADFRINLSIPLNFIVLSFLSYALERCDGKPIEVEGEPENIV